MEQKLLNLTKSYFKTSVGDALSGCRRRWSVIFEHSSGFVFLC
jgi:hypothetical protein